MRLNKYLFNRVNNKVRDRGQRSVVWLKRGHLCLHRSTVFSWRPFSSFSLWIIPVPPSLPPAPLILPLFNQCDGCLVPLAWGLMAGGRGFASHGGVTLSRGWLCQRWKPLDIPGTHLHSATQLLTWSSFKYPLNGTQHRWREEGGVSAPSVSGLLVSWHISSYRRKIRTLYLFSVSTFNALYNTTFSIHTPQHKITLVSTSWSALSSLTFLRICQAAPWALCERYNWVYIIFYYIDTSVLLENIPLVKLIKTTSGTRVVYFP